MTGQLAKACGAAGQKIGLLGEGEFFGEMAVLFNYHRSASSRFATSLRRLKKRKLKAVAVAQASAMNVARFVPEA